MGVQGGTSRRACVPPRTPAAPPAPPQPAAAWRAGHCGARSPPRRAARPTLQELRRAYDEERRANDDLMCDADRDRQAIDDLKAR